MVLMVLARSKDNVLKSQEVSEIVQCFCFKAVSETFQRFRIEWLIGDCPMLLF